MLKQRGVHAMRFRNVATVIVSMGLGVGLAVALVRTPSRSGPRPVSDSGGQKSPAIATTSPPVCTSKLKLADLKGQLPTAIYEPGYNPATLQDLEVPIQEIFAEEPRTDTWASTVETKIGRRVLDDASRILPSVSKLTFDCKSTLCRLDFDFTSKEDLKAMGQLIHLLGAAPGTSFVVDREAKRANVYLFYLSKEGDSAESLDADHTASNFDRSRSRAIQLLRDGSVPLPVGFSRSGVESL
jgi:hypothetical protein